MAKDHHEIHFESYITQKLVEQGWLEGSMEGYDQQRALFPEDVLAWVSATQPAALNKLTGLHGGDAQKHLLDRLEDVLKSKTGGTVNVLRGGFKIAGAGHIEMSQKAPEDLRNEKVNDRYKENRLRVVRQLKYCPTREWAIDLVFFINGLPVATVEVKTDFTQSVEEAVKQYKNDRLPIDPVTGRKEPLLTFKRGAIVHFAMSDSEIQMTTKLDGEATFFLPFNLGNNGHAGNPAREDGEYPVGYFWEEVLKPSAWLRIFHSFVYVETAEKVDTKGNPYTKETLIFPRFHQFEAVNEMIGDAKEFGIGRNYLCEHSAGSGKTSTIAWTAHDLICLRSDEGEALFNSVIIVTDRTVLDAQLQDAVQQIDHQFGVICAIDRQKSSLSKSKQLAEALMKGTPIIVVTIQTFPYAMEAIITEKSLADRRFAVIIDEAHTSQTGSNAQGLRAALSLDAKAKMEEMTVDELLLELQKSRVRPTNVSHFAFTATPKHSTMTLFGRPTDPTQPPSDINKPESFHRYTMRQAIEEGFILDVLENYMPYSVAVNLNTSLEKDKRVDKKYARRTLAKWISLHPTNVTQKVDFIVQHFKENVAPLLNGEAKAMIVTSSRASAVKYKLTLDNYIKNKSVEGIKALVAFSGKVKASDLGDISEFSIDDGTEFSESSMNSLGSVDIRNAFDQREYQIMLVANKFQTGFNQPKLVAMYVDKKISGIEAVQTLSRLNRTYPGKDKTFVIDFVNEAEVILAAFKQYDDGAELENVQNPNVVYDMQAILDDADIYNSLDLAAFKKTRDKSLTTGTVDSDIHKKLYAAIQRPTDVFNAKLKNLNDTIEQLDKEIDKAYAAGDTVAQKQIEHKRSEFAKAREALMRFKTNLSRFVRTYNYVAQLINFGDPDLENFAAFAQLLAKRLKGVSPEDIDLSGLIMTGWNIKADEMPDNSDKKPEKLKGIGGNEAPPSDREKMFLSAIIERINKLFGDIAPSEDQQHFVNQVTSHTTGNELVVEQINKNTKEQTMNGDLPKVVTQSVIQAMTSHTAIANVLLKDKQVMGEFVGIVYDLVKAGHSSNIAKE
jgi:type I restriction enzyme R subunit